MTYFPYLEDKEFLKQLDEERYREIYIRIEVLDFTTEQTIANIEGKSTGGSINLNGTSNMRRSGSLSMVVDPNGIDIGGESQDYYAITDVQNLISMNKKVRVFSGVRNTIGGPWSQYDIIWFPQGVYVIKSGNAARNGGGINLSLTINDKCALLNGDMGGTIPAATIFSESELYNSAGTTRIVEPVLIRDMVRRIVVEFGGEKPENVIIEDIPESIVKVIKWTGKDPLYLITTDGHKQYTLDEPAKDSGLTYKTFIYGQDVGYMNEPFVYPGRLECNAGESAASVLDKLKNTLGNFEWFYDVHGRFHFQEIKNYLNTSLSTEILNLSESDYLMLMNPTMSSYTFDNHNIITSISNAPQYANIKNDFVVWGTRKTSTGVQKPIRYHLAFEDKPTLREVPMEALVYRDYRDLQSVVKLNENDLCLNPDFEYLQNKNVKDIERLEVTTSGEKTVYTKTKMLYFPSVDNIDPSELEKEVEEVLKQESFISTTIVEENVKEKIEKNIRSKEPLIGTESELIIEEIDYDEDIYKDSVISLSAESKLESISTLFWMPPNEEQAILSETDASTYEDYWGDSSTIFEADSLTYCLGMRSLDIYSESPLLGIVLDPSNHGWDFEEESLKIALNTEISGDTAQFCFDFFIDERGDKNIYFYTNIKYDYVQELVDNEQIFIKNENEEYYNIGVDSFLDESFNNQCAILYFTPNEVKERVFVGVNLSSISGDILEEQDTSIVPFLRILGIQASDCSIERFSYLDQDTDSIELLRYDIEKPQKGVRKEIQIITYENLKKVLPSEGLNSKMYYLLENIIWAWDDELKDFREFPNYKYCKLLPGDWRTELYFQGLEASDKTFSRNYYAAELNAEWPKICDVLGGTLLENVEMGQECTSAYWPEQKADLYEYWLDFIEASDFSVNDIGRRVKVITDNNSNCLFPVEVPNYIIVEADGDVASERALAEKKRQEVIQVSPSIFKNFSLGGSQNAAFDKIKELLNTHTQYNESVTLSVIPIYYLEPNTRITINDPQMGIQGDYLIKSISLPLTASGTSNISCTKALSKTI